MPYIGAKELKASDIRRFDVTSSTSATHTLTWTPPTEQSLIVTINGIKQHEDAYSVSGTTLTLSSPLVATDKLEVIGINDIGTTITPAQNSVDTDKIANNAVTAAKLNTTGTASASTFLRGDMAWATPTDQGKVLQVVQGTYATQTSTSGTTYVTSNLSASITPSSASNKILFMATINSFYVTGSPVGGQLALYRDGLSIVAPIAGIYSGSGSTSQTTSLNYLDSPSSTSSLTYEIYFRKTTGTTAFVHDSNFPSYMILMEIAG